MSSRNTNEDIQVIGLKRVELVDIASNDVVSSAAKAAGRNGHSTLGEKSPMNGFSSSATSTSTSATAATLAVNTNAVPPLLPPLVGLVKPVVLPYKLNLPSLTDSFPTVISLNHNKKMAQSHNSKSVNWSSEFFYSNEYDNGVFIFFVYVLKRLIFFCLNV